MFSTVGKKRCLEWMDNILGLNDLKLKHYNNLMVVIILICTGLTSFLVKEDFAYLHLYQQITFQWNSWSMSYLPSIYIVVNVPGMRNVNTELERNWNSKIWWKRIYLGILTCSFRVGLTLLGPPFVKRHRGKPEESLEHWLYSCPIFEEWRLWLFLKALVLHLWLLDQDFCRDPV